MNYSFINLERELSFAEVAHFFSKNEEFFLQFIDDSTMKLTLKCFESIEDGKSKYLLLDTTLYKPTFQSLIRDIQSLGYRKNLEQKADLESNKEIFEKVAKIIKSYYLRADIKLDVKIDSSLSNDFGLDDLDVVEIVMKIEKEFNLTIEDKDYKNFKTVKNIVEYIQREKV